MSTQQEREITIYATRGGNMKKITTAVTSWGELKPLVKAEGFDLNSLLAAENINKSDLVNDLAVLPASAFRLFLRPKQTKSGGTPDRKECFTIIKAHIAAFPEDKHLFSIDGKNVTQLPTATVQDLVAKYCQKVKKAKKEAPIQETGNEVAKEAEKEIQAEPVEAVKEETATEDLTHFEIVKKAINLLLPLEGFGYDSFNKCEKHLNKLLAEIDPNTVFVKEEVVETQAEIERKEKEALKKEATDMGY